MPVVTPTVSGLDDYTAKWAYNQITAKQQKLYARLFEGAKNVSDSCYVEDIGVTEDDLFKAYWAFDYDNPQFLELGSGYSFRHYQGSSELISVEIDYGRKSSKIAQAQFDSTMNDVIAKASSQGSDYEKLKYAHDWLVNNSEYDQSDVDKEYTREADGPVVYGKAVCEGYAKAFMYLAQSMGYECICVIGGAKGVEHMWNMVKVGGQWYHVDVTWDDPIMSDGSDALYHTYFLVGDELIRREHSVDTPFRVPSAPGNYVR